MTKETEEVAEVAEEATETVTEETPKTVQTKSEVEEKSTTEEPTPKKVEVKQEDTKAEPDKVERVVPSAEKYTLPEGVPPEVAKFANANDMTQEQLDTTLKTFGEYLSSSNEAEKTQVLESGKELIKTWGDKSKSNISTINRTLSHIDPKGELKEFLETSGYVNHPIVLNHLLAVGDTLKEGGFVLGNNNTPAAGVTAAQAMFPNHKSVQH